MGGKTVKKFKKVRLKYDTAFKYFNEKLQSANELSNQCLKNIDFKQGVFFSIFPEGSNIPNINDFYVGNRTPNIRNIAYEFILDKLKKTSNLSCIFDDVASTYSSDYSDPLFISNGLHYHCEIYYTILPQKASLETINRCFVASDAIWHLLCVLFKYDSPEISNHQITKDQIRKISENVEMIIVGAYDGEGYVFWEKTYH